jgi:hypothetical protein
LALGSREAKRKDFRAIMEEAKEKKTIWEFKDIQLSSAHT